MIHSLQFFRFLAFFSIFTLHAQNYGCFRYHGTAAMAVSFFIVLSGFLSGLNADGEYGKPSIKEWGKYIWKKISKFYPLHFSLLLISALYFKGGVFQIFIDGDPKAFSIFVKLFLENALLIQSWFDDQYFTFNGVSWFLSTIMFLYACSPWLKWGLVHACNGRRWLALSFAISFFGLNYLYCYLVGRSEANLEFWVYVFPPSRLAEFAAGISLGIFLSDIVGEQKSSPTHFCMMSLLEVGVIWLVIQGVLGRWSFGEWGSRSTDYLVQELVLIGVFAVQGGFISRILRNRVSLVLGILSAPAFLIHQVLISRVSANFYRLAVDDDQKYVPFFLLLFLTLVFSFIVARKRIMETLKNWDPVTGGRLIGSRTYLGGVLCCAAFIVGLALLSPLRKKWETIRIRLSENQEWNLSNCAYITVFYASPDKPHFDTKRQSILLNGIPSPGEWYTGFIPLGTNKIRIDFRQKKKSSKKDLRYPRIEEILIDDKRHDPTTLRRQIYEKDIDPMLVLEWSHSKN